MGSPAWDAVSPQTGKPFTSSAVQSSSAPFSYPSSPPEQQTPLTPHFGGGPQSLSALSSRYALQLTRSFDLLLGGGSSERPGAF